MWMQPSTWETTCVSRAKKFVLFGFVFLLCVACQLLFFWAVDRAPFNARGVATARGGLWYAATVKNVLARA